MSVLGAHYRPNTMAKSSGILQDLKEYFRRPSVISSGNLTLDVTGNQLFNNVSITNLVTWFPNFLNRLTGVAGLSFDTVFTLQVSTTPFSQGVLALAWQYGEPSTNGVVRVSYPALCTNVPHVRLDIAELTMVQLKVPFVSSSQFLDIASQTNLGLFGMNAILPIRAGAVGNTAPSYRLMIHLENLKLFYATPAATAPVVFQAGKLSPIGEEFENDAYPFSSSLHSMGRTVNWIARGIPSLSSLSGPTSWFLGKAAGLVRYFGYSKPLVQEPMKRVLQFTTALEHNVDIPSSAIMVGPMASNRLKIDANIACTDVDEMSFDYVLTQWSQLARFSLDTTVTVNTNIWGTCVSPKFFWFKSNPSGASFQRNPLLFATPATANAFIPTNLFFWAQAFKLWRGDVEFRFTFSKTKMHAGRVMVAFNPIGGAVFNPAGPNNATITAQANGSIAPFAYSAVFDLKDSNVFTFTVPYYDSVGYSDVDEHTGTLVMKVFDTLKTSAMTSPNIQCLVEVRGLPGFELAYPKTIDYIVSDNDVVPIYQSGIVAVINDNASEQCIGEHITSVKQLISIPNEVESNLNAFLAYGIGPYKADFRAIYPWYVRAPYPSSALPNTYTYTASSAGAYAYSRYAANAYLFARGSTDVHVNAISTTPLSFYAIQMPTWNTTVSGIYRVIGAVGTVFTGFSGHFRYPGYQRPARTPLPQADLVAPITTTIPLTTSPVDPNYTCGLRVMNPSSVGAWYQIRTSAGDDAMLGHYVGPPFLQLPSAAAGISDNWTAQFTQNGTVVPLTALAAGPLPAAAAEEPSVGTAVMAAAINTEPILTDITQIVDTYTKVSPFSVTPPPPMTSGDDGVTPARSGGSLTGRLPRAFKLNADDVKSILDTVNSVLQ